MKQDKDKNIFTVAEDYGYVLTSHKYCTEDEYINSVFRLQTK